MDGWKEGLAEWVDRRVDGWQERIVSQRINEYKHSWSSGWIEQRKSSCQYKKTQVSGKAVVQISGSCH